MKALCPKHKKELQVYLTAFDKVSYSLDAIAGICPDCKDGYFYIANGKFSSIQDSDRTYRFLSALENADITIGKPQIPVSEQLPPSAADKPPISEKEKAPETAAKAEEKPEKPAEPANIYKPTAVHYKAVKEKSFVSGMPMICTGDGQPLVKCSALMPNGTVKTCYFCTKCKCAYVESHITIRSKSDTRKAPVLPPQERLIVTGTAINDFPLSPPEPRLKMNDSAHRGGKSTIIVANIKRYDKPLTIKIVENQNEADSTKGIYHADSLHAAMLMHAIIYGRTKFKVRDEENTLFGYTAYEESRPYFEKVCSFCTYGSQQTVYVFNQKTVPHGSADDYEIVTAIIPFTGSEYPVAATVYYQKSKNRYFINSAEYQKLQQKHGFPYLNLQPSPYERFTGNGLNAESKLHILGYNVSSGSGKSAADRQKLLKDIVDGGALKKAEILSHLEWLISKNQHIDKMVSAVSKWESDYAFLKNYKAASSSAVWLNVFTAKNSENAVLSLKNANPIPVKYTRKK